MSKVVTPIFATVEFVTETKSGNFGDYRSVLFKTIDGGKIWKSFDPDSPELGQLPVGTRVQLIESGVSKSGKPSHNVVLLSGQPTAAIAPTTPTAPSPAPAGTIPDGQKAAIASYVSDMARLYSYCHSEAAKAMESQSPDPETVRCAASSLFISASRKFGL